MFVIRTGGVIEILGDKVGGYSYQYYDCILLLSIVTVPNEVLPITAT